MLGSIGVGGRTDPLRYERTLQFGGLGGRRLSIHSDGGRSGTGPTSLVDRD
jgi:hypothetical protein